MFVYTIKSRIKKPKKAIALLLFALLLVGVLVYITNSSASSKAYCKAVGEYSTRFGTDGDKTSFLSLFNVQGELVTIDSVRIPENFNSVYEEYNEMQKKMGLDLEKYRGKTVKRYVYETKDRWFVSVLCYKNRVVACHKSTNIYGDKFVSLIGTEEK